MRCLWPLAGLAIEPTVARPLVDFEHPRRSPDRHARLRQRMLAAAAILLVAVGAFWTYARRDLAGLDTRLQQLEIQRRNDGAEAVREGRGIHRLQHLERWEEVQVDWIEHLVHLQSLLPPSGTIVLDGWSGSLDFDGIDYDHRATRGEKWIVDASVIFAVEGEAVDRRVADEFRERLVIADPYRATSTGAEREGGRRLPIGFNYRLTSSRMTPIEKKASSSDVEGPSGDASSTVARSDRASGKEDA